MKYGGTHNKTAEHVPSCGRGPNIHWWLLVNETTFVFTITNSTRKKKKRIPPFLFNCYYRQTSKLWAVLSSQKVPGCFLNNATDVAEMLGAAQMKAHDLPVVGSIGSDNNHIWTPAPLS